jgi:hypothetical protein
MKFTNDFLNIGSVPVDEDCAQIGRPAYEVLSRLECQAFKEQLQRRFPNGVFFVKTFYHEFGAYKEVCAFIDIPVDDDCDTETIRTVAAFEAEGNTPDKWDNEAREWLEKNSYFEILKESLE